MVLECFKMSFRIEEKILVNSKNNFLVQKFFACNNAKKLFEPRIVESLYFDNNQFDMHKDSEEGIAPRKKIRIRTYPKTSIKHFLEIKISSVEGRYKTSREIKNHELLKFLKNGIFDYQYGHCKPKIYVRYVREYFLMKNIRITYDKNIEYLNSNKKFIAKENSSVLEIKPGSEKNMDDISLDFPYSRSRYSKYCFGVNRLNSL